MPQFESGIHAEGEQNGMRQDVKQVFDETLGAFPGTRYGVCPQPVQTYLEQGYNYAMIIYHPYAEIMGADSSYEEERQHQQERRGAERTSRIRQAITQACQSAQIPFLIPGSSPYTMKPPFTALLSAKYIGWNAGVGWIGKNDLLITYEYGPHIFTIPAVFYAESFPTGTPVTKSECGDCDLCVRACPFRNLTGKLWTPSTLRDEMINCARCSETRFRIAEKRGMDHKYTCAKCLLACPRGLKNVQLFIDGLQKPTETTAGTSAGKE